MQSLFDFIVKPSNNKRYNNTTDIEWFRVYNKHFSRRPQIF